MTTARNTSALARVIARTRYVLLDFDGPICKIFTYPTADTVTARLMEVVDAHGIETPQQVSEAGPHDVLLYSASISPKLAHKVEEVLRASEIEAAAMAAPTPGADELLQTCKQVGRPVAVVSNNTAKAVATYLERMELTKLVTHIQGRHPADPFLMKPNPYSIDQALRALGANAEACVLVGDSVSDIQAAQAAGTGSIGYANKPKKHQRLTETGADTVIAMMGDLATAFARVS